MMNKNKIPLLLGVLILVLTAWGNILWPQYISFGLVIVYLMGRHEQDLKVWLPGSFKRIRYRMGGWRKIDSPWPLFEKKFPNGVTYRAVNWDGMKQADERYKKTNNPEPKI